MKVFFHNVTIAQSICLHCNFTGNGLAGEAQQPSYPGLPRGLVAVLLYYDGRLSMVSALKSLIQAREGHTWTLGLSEELVSMINIFTKKLNEEGLTDKILGKSCQKLVSQNLKP